MDNDSNKKNTVFPDIPSYLASLGESMVFSGQCLLFLTVVYTAIFSISELAARETVLTLLNARVAALKSDFVEQNKNPDLGTSQEKNGEHTQLQYLKEDTLEEIKFTESLKRDLQTLIAVGSEDRSFSLRFIQGKFGQRAPAASEPRESSNPIKSFISASSQPILLQSSDQLLAFAILACGAIGSMVASLRAGQSMTLRAFVLGLASGFVVYLAIKGGKHLFLLQAQGELVAFNPYGSAFAGLLAGLFTEKAHQLLSAIVDDFVERVRTAAGKKNQD